MTSERARLGLYAEVVAMWRRGFDTHWIAQALGLDEPTVCRWVWNFREAMRGQGA